MSVIGVDPGLSGAMARLDYTTGALDIQDMPTWNMVVAKKTRTRVDANDLIDYFELQKMMGAELVLIEAVGGRPKQSASAAFVFGYTVGLIYMACISVRLPIETVPPQVWKKVLGLPGKKEKQGKTSKEQNGLIIQRADELMPEYRNLWRGPQGGYKLDRAEAAMLAYYAAKYALNSTKAVDIRDPEWKLAYRNADTGS